MNLFKRIKNLWELSEKVEEEPEWYDLPEEPVVITKVPKGKFIPRVIKDPVQAIVEETPQ